jgi:hypothetical protein
LYKKQYLCNAFVTVLTAPAKCVGTARNGFDSSITYENIRSWFENSKSLGLRRVCKVGVLNAAIRKKENLREKSKAITEFWFKYYGLVQEIAPELYMPTPEPHSGGFLYFNPPATSGIKFVHKVNRGQIDLRFARMGTQVSKLKELFQKQIRLDRMKIVKTHKSAAIRTTVDILITVDDFEEQKQKVINCILEAKAVLQWWIEHHQVVT